METGGVIVIFFNVFVAKEFMREVLIDFPERRLGIIPIVEMVT